MFNKLKFASIVFLVIYLINSCSFFKGYNESTKNQTDNSDKYDKKEEVQNDAGVIKPSTIGPDSVDQKNTVNKSNIIFSKAIKDSVKEEKVSVPIDSVVDSANFASEEWISLEGLKNENEINDEVNNKIYVVILDLIDDIRNRNIPEYLENQLSYLEKEWQKEKDRKNRDWIDRFFLLEEEVNKAYQDYIKICQKEDDFKNEIAQFEQEKSTLVNRIKNYENNIQQFKNWRTKAENNYQARLSSIPYNVLLIGRANYPEEGDHQNVRQKVSETIQKKAIEVINEVRIFQLDILKNDEKLKSFVAEINEGHALISDSYQCIKIKGFNPIYLQILRIEVYPFYKISTGKSINFNESEPEEKKLGVEIYEYSNKDDFLTSLSENIPNQTLSQLNLNESEINFLKSQQLNISEANNLTKEKVTNIRNKYFDDISKYDQDISMLESDIEQLRKRIKLIEDKIVGNELQLKDTITKDKGIFLATLKEAEENYQKHYKNRESLVNKNVRTVLDVSRGNISETLKNIVLSSRKILDDLKRQSLRSAVIYGTETNQIFTINQKEIEYRPDLIAFRVLYLGAEDFAPSVNYYASIAYKVKWTPLSIEIIKVDSTAVTVEEQPKKQVHNIGVQLDKPPLEIVENYIKNGIDTNTTTGNVLIDYWHKKVWYQYTSKETEETVEVKSPNYANIEAPPPGFRKPTYTELCDLENAKNKMDNDIFKNIGWKSDYPFFADEQVFDSVTNRKLFKCRDFNSGSEVTIAPVEKVYILWVKNLSEKEQ